MISVAHRATVAKFHHRRLTLHPETRSIEDGVGVTCPLTVRSVDKIARKTMGISALIAHPANARWKVAPCSGFAAARVDPCGCQRSSD